MSEKRRKFQVCNGYLLEFEQLARVLSFLAENAELKKVSRDALVEGTGLANRQIESLVSVGAAMGLIRPGNQVLTPVGRVVAKHDVFIEARGTLEWCHYVGSGAHRNLIWYEIFNTILPNEAPMTADRWMDFLRGALAGQYTDRTIGKHLHEEVRFVADAYLNRNFKKLAILQEASDQRLYRRRLTELTPKILAAMVYDFGSRSQSELLQIDALLTQPGSPGLLFALEKETLREMAEGLHRNRWLRYESTHNLDQIRLQAGLSPADFLTAYYEDSEPSPCREEGKA
jgi:hypothetical protein